MEGVKGTTTVGGLWATKGCNGAAERGSLRFERFQVFNTSVGAGISAETKPEVLDEETVF